MRDRPGGGGMSRRRLLGAAAVSLVLTRLAHGRGPWDSSPAGDSLVTAEQRASVEQGVRWIARRQHSGGKWGEKNETRVADTALCVLALMAAGNTVTGGRRLEAGAGLHEETYPPTLRGPHARKVQEGLRYLARLAWSDTGRKRVRGYIQDDKRSRMHGHGFATLALAQAAGNLGGRPVREIREDLAADPGVNLSLADQVRWGLHLAVNCTERAQDPSTGGWLYEPDAHGHEGSMTVTQILALRAARDAGIAVNGAVLKKAYNYVRTSQNLHDRKLYGGFAYTKTQKGRVSYALTAAALTTLYGLGRYGLDSRDRKMIDDGLKFMDRRLDRALDTRQWFYYGMFYGAQALYQSQDAGRLRTQWPRIRDALIRQQQGDGEFSVVDREQRSPEYCTAMGVLTLQVPMETLPIFQRR